MDGVASRCWRVALPVPALAARRGSFRFIFISNVPRGRLRSASIREEKKCTAGTEHRAASEIASCARFPAHVRAIRRKMGAPLEALRRFPETEAKGTDLAALPAKPRAELP